MYLIFDDTKGWMLTHVPDGSEYPVGQVADNPFPTELFSDLDMYIHPTADGCHIWTGGAHRRSRSNAGPYYLNRCIPQPYKYQISARQLVLARHLNRDIVGMPRFRIGMICTRNLCVAVEHMIPFNYFPRTQYGTIARPTEAPIPTKVLTEAEKEAVRRAVLGDLDEERAKPKVPIVYDTETIQKIIGNGGRTVEQFTPQELEEIERKKNQKPIEEPTTLDQIGFGTKDPIK